ncbi:MAG: transcriptional repressor [Chloroflexi bacterium]|nr:transcriptional repressor [Chloroflexota bacterium]
MSTWAPGSLFLEERVGQAGHRLTGPRLALFRAIARYPEGFTAEELRDQHPSIGRATVYRTIRLLVDLGLVCKIALPEGAPRYVVAGGGHHHHAVCIECGAVKEFRYSTVESVLGELRADVMGQIVGHRIEVYVRCGSCVDQGGRTGLAPVSTP